MLFFKHYSELNSFQIDSIINLYIETFSIPPRNKKLSYEFVKSFIFSYSPYISFLIKDSSIIGYF